MLKRYSEILGLPVVCIKDGKKAGTIEDILFSPVEREVKAVLLEHKGMEIRKRFIRMKDVLSIGGDAVVIDNASCIGAVSRAAYEKEFKDEGNLLGLHAFTKEGKDLGLVKDVIFDQGTGRIESVELSDGFINDIVQGRSVLPLFGRVEFGQENILVEREAVEEMVNTGGGIKNRLFDRN